MGKGGEETKALMKAEGGGKAAKADKDAEPKEPKALVKESYDGETTDAAIISASRFVHAGQAADHGGLKIDDTIGFCYQICLHSLVTTILFLFAAVYFWFLEESEDPWDPASTAFQTIILDKAIATAVPLSNVTTLAGFPKLDAQTAKYTLDNCRQIRHDVTLIHILFMGVFIGVIVQKVFKIIHRLRVLVLLPVNDWHKWSDYDKTDKKGPKKDQFHYSMRNWNAGNNLVDHMTPIFKVLIIILVLIPEMLFTFAAFWSGVKLFATRVGSPEGVVRSALKAGFLLKMNSLYFTNFTSHNFKVYLQEGYYWIPQTEEEAKEEKKAGKSDKVTWTDMWDLWGSTVAIFVLGFGISILLTFTQFGHMLDFKDSCISYERSLNLADHKREMWDDITAKININNLFDKLIAP